MSEHPSVRVVSLVDASEEVPDLLPTEKLFWDYWPASDDVSAEQRKELLIPKDTPCNRLRLVGKSLSVSALQRFSLDLSDLPSDEAVRASSGGPSEVSEDVLSSRVNTHSRSYNLTLSFISYKQLFPGVHLLQPPKRDVHLPPGSVLEHKFFLAKKGFATLRPGLHAHNPRSKLHF